MAGSLLHLLKYIYRNSFWCIIHFQMIIHCNKDSFITFQKTFLNATYFIYHTKAQVHFSSTSSTSVGFHFSRRVLSSSNKPVAWDQPIKKFHQLHFCLILVKTLSPQFHKTLSYKYLVVFYIYLFYFTLSFFARLFFHFQSSNHNTFTK